MVRKIAVLFLVAAVTTLFFFSFSMPKEGPGDRAWGQDSEQVISEGPWPGLVRISPILITGDGDWAAVAASGDGTPGNPWIVENFLIEANDSTYGILVTGTDDYYVIRNGFINETYDDSSYGYGVGTQCHNGVVLNVTFEACRGPGVGSGGANNLQVINCTFRDFVESLGVTPNCINLFMTNNSIVKGNVITNCTYHGGMNVQGWIGVAETHNVTFRNNVINETIWGIRTPYAYDVLIENCSMYNQFDNWIGADYCDGLVIENCTFRDYRFIGIEFRDGEDLVINNCLMYNESADEAIYINTVDNVTITNNDIYSDCGYIATIALVDVTNALVENNTLDPTNPASGITGVAEQYLGIFCGDGDNVTITNNTIFSCRYGPYIMIYDNNVTVNENTFVSDEIENAITVTAGAEVRIYNNTFMDYSAKAAINILTNPVDVTVYNNYFINVSNRLDGSNITGVSFHHNLYSDYFDVFPYAITANLTTSVLEYQYVVGNHGWPDIWTLNDSYPIYDAVYWPRGDKEVSYYLYSLIDFIGVTFEWFKLYIDGAINVRQFSNPAHVLYDVEVKDFAQRTIFHEIVNLNDSAALEIGVNITTLIIQNKFDDKPVLFSLTRDNHTTVFPLAPEQIYQLRVVTGTYSYSVTDMAGNTLDDENGTAIDTSVTVAGPSVVSFGFKSVVPGDVINNYSSGLLDYVIVGGVLGGSFAAIIYLGTRQKRQASGKRSAAASTMTKIKEGLERVAR